MAGKSFLEELGIDVGKVEKVETTGKPPVGDASQLIGPAQPNEKHPKSDQPARKAAAAKKSAGKEKKPVTSSNDGETRKSRNFSLTADAWEKLDMLRWTTKMSLSDIVVNAILEYADRYEV